MKLLPRLMSLLKLQLMPSIEPSRSSKRSRNEAEKHPCLHQEIPHKAEKHLLARQAAEGNDEPLEHQNPLNIRTGNW